MDSSSSSSLPYGSPTVVAGDDDGAFAAGLAKEAAQLFQAGKFADCLRILNQLLQKKPDDAKVRHNIAIAKSFQDGCSDPMRLIEELENVKKQSEEHVRASREGFEVSDNNGSKNSANTRGSNIDTHRFSSTCVYTDEFDTSVAMFNIAVIWFHLHGYAKSFSYLDALYQNVEPIGEGTALRICLLLLDVALLSDNASRSADVISYMEKAFCASSLTNQAESGTSAQPQPLLISKSSSFISNSTISDAPYPDSVGTTNPSENPITRSLSEEALEDEPLQLLSSLNISRQNLQRPGIASSNDIPRIQAEESLSAVDLRLKLHLYKVRFWLLTRNLKAAKREVKMAMNVARGKDYPMALYLKSQLEYARGNHRKAIKLLMASSGNCTEAGILNMHYNNLGCIDYRLGKYHSSGDNFSKALKSSSLVRKEKPRKLITFLQDKSLHITYNCGLHALACGRPFLAARCFQTASLIFYKEPLLWLRIAESCLMALEKGLIKSEKSDIRVNVVGKGKWRQLAITYANGTSRDHLQESVGKDNLLLSDSKQPDLSMTLARQCLVNALFLLDGLEAKYSKYFLLPYSEESDSKETLLSAESKNHKNVNGGNPKVSNVVSGSSQPHSNGEAKEQKGGNIQTGSFQNSITNYGYIRLKENQMIKQATLAGLAYVELELGNPLNALSAAKSLTKLPVCSRMYTFLGTMYATEALCLLNRPKEAAEHLMTYIASSGNVQLPYSQEDCKKWSSGKVVDSEESNVISAADESQKSVFLSPEEGRGIFCANCAAYFALVGDLEKAHQFVTKALSDIPNSSQAILTAIYLDVKRGKIQDALAKLKQHNRVRFLALNGCP